MSTRSRRSAAGGDEVTPTPVAPVETFPCTWEGCTHKPFQTKRGMQGHIKAVHETDAAKTPTTANRADPSLEEESEEPVATPKSTTKKPETKATKTSTPVRKTADKKTEVSKASTPASKTPAKAKEEPKTAAPMKKADPSTPAAKTTDKKKEEAKAKTPVPKAVDKKKEEAKATTPAPKTVEKKKEEPKVASSVKKTAEDTFDVQETSAPTTTSKRTITPKPAAKATPGPSEPSSSAAAPASTRVTRKRAIENTAASTPSAASSSATAPSTKKKRVGFFDTPLREATRKLVCNDGIKQEIDEHHVSVTRFAERVDPPQTVFSVGEMAKKLLPLLTAKQGLTKRKTKKEYCIACLDFKLTNDTCSNEHNDNDDRIQKHWTQLFPDRNPILLTKQQIYDDLTIIATEWS